MPFAGDKMKKQRLPIKGSIPWITIEKIHNGYLLIAPSENGSNTKKYHRGTMNGVMQFLESIWGYKYINANEQEELETKENAEIPKS